MAEPTFLVKNLHVDLHNFQQHFDHSKYDFQIMAQYIDQHTYNVIVYRLDQDAGWNININVLACDFQENGHKIIHIGQSNDAEKSIQVHTDSIIEPSTTLLERLPRYKLVQSPNPNAISRQEFNKIFSTDIVVLPSLIFAVGLVDQTVYMYNEKYSHYSEIIHQIKHLISVALSENIQSKLYFVVCAADGYPESHYYYSNRHIPKIANEMEYQGKAMVQLNPDEYAVLHKNKYILTQSQHRDMPYSVGIYDRHYFYCNLYNPFRSFHNGIPFHTKVSKIVFGARIPRGSVHNFIERRDITVNQRQYFVSDAIPKDNIVCSSTEWIDNKEMIKYKYILDIDGGASTWDATAWKLNSGSVIFKTESAWRQWFYDEYLPWIHYVPVKNDFSDIQEQFHWCEANPEKCKQMVQNCLELFQKTFRFHKAIEYSKGVLMQINNI